jgi:hypothetical protein
MNYLTSYLNINLIKIIGSYNLPTLITVKNNKSKILTDIDSIRGLFDYLNSVKSKILTDIDSIRGLLYLNSIKSKIAIVNKCRILYHKTWIYCDKAHLEKIEN